MLALVASELPTPNKSLFVHAMCGHGWAQVRTCHAMGGHGCNLKGKCGPLQRSSVNTYILESLLSQASQT